MVSVNLAFGNGLLKSWGLSKTLTNLEEDLAMWIGKRKKTNIAGQGNGTHSPKSGMSLLYSGLEADRASGRKGIRPNGPHIKGV